MSIELKTPFEIIEELVSTIEKIRKRKKLRQKDLCNKSGVSISTYQKFLYEKTINLTSLIKIMYTLNMMNNLECFIKYEELLTIDDIRNKQKKNMLPKRIRKANDK